MSDTCGTRVRRLSLPIEPFTYAMITYAVVVLATCAVGFGQDLSEPDAEVARSSDQHITSNQGASIDAPTADVPASQVDTTPPPLEGQAGTVAATPTRTIRRRTAGVSEETLLGGRSTPWYRTGLGALTVVLGLVGLVFLLARRYVPSIRAADGGALRVVTRTSLTAKQTLALIRLGRRFVMVAISPNRVDVLSEISDPDEVAELTAQTGAAGPGGPSEFNDLLSSETDAFDVPDHAKHTERRKSSGPVADLLTRLRSLQRSH